MISRPNRTSTLLEEGPTHLKAPVACSDEQRLEFARLVRQGFEGSDEGLDSRILAAKWLAFHYTEAAKLGAIGALKVPTHQFRDYVFGASHASVTGADIGLELGWVFVVPSERGNGIARDLCRLLLAREPASRVFATTRPDNTPMIRILVALGFTQDGTPFRHPRRNEELVMFLR